MSSNKHRYTLLRISRLLLAPIYSLLAVFIKKNNNIVITASLNMEFSDNARALFEELVQLDEYKQRVYFVINDEQKRQALNLQYPGRFISNLSFKDAAFILKAKYWFFSAMELPLGVFYQRHLRQVVHLGHGMLYKRIGLRENHISWYKKAYYFLIASNFSYTISTTDFFVDEISQGFGIPKNRILLLPQPKTAQVAYPMAVNNQLLAQSDITNILHAPTWRPYADVELFPFDDLDLNELDKFLLENSIHIWLRVHPRFEQGIDSEVSKLENIHLFSANEYSEVNKYLSYFDGLITDYSSIYFDFLTLERPVLFFDYDFTEYNRQVGVIDDYKQVKSIETTISQQHFVEQLRAIKTGGFCLDRIRKANKLTNFDIPNENVLEYLLVRFFENV